MTRNREYKPLGSHEALWRCHDRWVLCDGPAGTGKTRAVLEKVYLYALKYPGARVLLTRKTRASMTESVLVTFETYVLPEGSPLLRDGPTRAGRASYVLPNGSELVLCGLDNVDRLMSSEYDLAVVFEATEATQDDWEKIDTRLRATIGPYRQLIADCNPSGPRHWLKKKADAEELTRFASTHSDNPRVTEEYLVALGRLTGHRRLRLFEGRWAAAEGLVFPDLARAVVDPWEELPHGRFVGGVDFGWNDQFAALGAWLCDDDDVLYVFYERYMSKTPLAVHAAALGAVSLGVWSADPSRPDSIRQMRAAGLVMRRAHNSILSGIDAINTRLATHRLRVSSVCTALLEEVDAYRYPNGGEGEVPIDEFNHTVDALRYLVMSVDARRLATLDMLHQVEPEEVYA